MTAEFQELRGRLNLLHRDGHPIPAEFSAFGTLDAEGRFAGANGSVRDMSERERLERELRESEVSLPLPHRELPGHHLLGRSGRPIQLRI